MEYAIVCIYSDMNIFPDFLVLPLITEGERNENEFRWGHGFGW